MRDVIVVGAGVAGLVAAAELERGGLSVLVVEARSRIGGRTWSPLIGGEHRDLGATWVWESEPHVLARLEQLGIETHASWEEGDSLYEVGGAVQRVRRPRSAVAALRAFPKSD